MPYWSDTHFQVFLLCGFPCWNKSEAPRTGLLFSRSPACYRTHKYIHVQGDCDSCNGSDSGSVFTLSLHPVHRKRCYTSRTSGSLPPTVRIKTSGNHRTFSRRTELIMIIMPIIIISQVIGHRMRCTSKSVLCVRVMQAIWEHCAFPLEFRAWI